MDQATTSKLTQLRSLLDVTWHADTSTDPNGWTPARASVGQCGVSALIVQDLLGGRIVCSRVCGNSHFWNQLSDGTDVDLTRDQFPVWCLTTPIEESSRDYVLGTMREDGTSTARRYQTLLRRLQARGFLGRPLDSVASQDAPA